MTRFPDPPGEDHRETAASRQADRASAQRDARERDEAETMLADARRRHATPCAVLVSLFDDHGITPVVVQAVQAALDEFRTVAYSRGYRDAMTDQGDV